MKELLTYKHQINAYTSNILTMKFQIANFLLFFLCAYNCHIQAQQTSIKTITSHHSFDMSNLKIYKEEFDTNPEEIKRAEEIWGARFPEEFKAFLLKYNGVSTFPDFPTIKAENDSELWGIERFLSVKDIILEKEYLIQYDKTVTYDQEDLEKHGLKRENLLIFALGYRGWYFLNLDVNSFGQIYFCNYSGGDGIVKIYTKSFQEFINSLGVDKGDDSVLDPHFEFKKKHFYSYKIFQKDLFWTPLNPELGLQRFKEVYAELGDIQPTENGYRTIAQYYVDDRLKLEYLLSQGCSTEGLLNYTNQAETVQYLVKEKGLDMNKSYKGGYPLRNYLSTSSMNDAKIKYEMIDKLLEMGIDLDWNIQAKKWDGSTDLPMLKKLEVLNKEYLEYENYNKNFWIKNGKPSGHIPFKKSKLIEEMLEKAKR